MEEGAHVQSTLYPNPKRECNRQNSRTHLWTVLLQRLHTDFKNFQIYIFRFIFLVFFDTGIYGSKSIKLLFPNRQANSVIKIVFSLGVSRSLQTLYKDFQNSFFKFNINVWNVNFFDLKVCCNSIALKIISCYTKNFRGNEILYRENRKKIFSGKEMFEYILRQQNNILCIRSTTSWE